MSPDELVKVWRAGEGLMEAVSVSADALNNTFQYYSALADTQAESEMLQKVSNFFCFLGIFASGTSKLARKKCIQAADEIVAEVESGAEHGIDGELYSVLVAMKSEDEVAEAVFKNELNNIDTGTNPNVLVTKFDEMTTWEKQLFRSQHEKYGKDDDIWQLFNDDGGEAFDIWRNVLPSFRAERNSIKFIKGLCKLLHFDPNAMDHFLYRKIRKKSGSTKYRTTGGHKGAIVFQGLAEHFTRNVDGNIDEILDPEFVHIIDDELHSTQIMIDYVQGTADAEDLYSVTYKNGHALHRNIFFKKLEQPLTNTELQNEKLVLNGIAYEYKSMQTIINPIWSNERIAHELAYAISERTFREQIFRPKKHDVLNKEWSETTWISQFRDGTEVIIKHVTHHRYNLLPYFEDHYSYFELKIEE